MAIFPVTTLAMKCRTSQILDCANSFLVVTTAVAMALVLAVVY